MSNKRRFSKVKEQEIFSSGSKGGPGLEQAHLMDDNKVHQTHLLALPKYVGHEHLDCSPASQTFFSETTPGGLRS